MSTRLTLMESAFVSGWTCAIGATVVASTMKATFWTPPLNWLDAVPSLVVGAAVGASGWCWLRQRATGLALLTLAVSAIGILSSTSSHPLERDYVAESIALQSIGFGLFVGALCSLVDVFAAKRHWAAKFPLGIISSIALLLLLGTSGRWLVDPYGGESILRALPIGCRSRVIAAEHGELLGSTLPLLVLGIIPALVEALSGAGGARYSWPWQSLRWACILLGLPIASAAVLFFCGHAWMEFSKGPMYLTRAAKHTVMARPMRDILDLIRLGYPERIAQFCDESLAIRIDCANWDSSLRRDRLSKDLRTLSQGRVTYDSLHGCKPRHPDNVGRISLYNGDVRLSYWVTFSRSARGRRLSNWVVSDLQPCLDKEYFHRCGPPD